MSLFNPKTFISKILLAGFAAFTLIFLINTLRGHFDPTPGQVHFGGNDWKPVANYATPGSVALAIFIILSAIHMFQSVRWWFLPLLPLALIAGIFLFQATAKLYYNANGSLGFYRGDAFIDLFPLFGFAATIIALVLFCALAARLKKSSR